MVSNHDKLDALQCAAIELLICAIERHPDHNLPELQFSIKMLRKYADDPTPNLFSMARIAFDDLETDVRNHICADAHDLAVKSAAALSARTELRAITSKLGHSETKADTGTEKPEAKAKAKSFTTPLLAALHREK